MRSERESAPRLGNPGRSNQQATTHADADDDNAATSPYRITWSRRGWTELRERAFESEDAARRYFDFLRCDRPGRASLVNLKLELWAGEAWGWAPRLALCGDSVYDTANTFGRPRIGDAERPPAETTDDQRPAVIDDLARQRAKRRSNEWPWSEPPRPSGWPWGAS